MVIGKRNLYGPVEGFVESGNEMKMRKLTNLYMV